ncbi:MAG: tyrosine-type recombinase/integrase, partial [Phycisphaeraceae bacterium]
MPHDASVVRLAHLVDRFIRHEAPQRYRIDGRPTRHVQNMQAVLRRLLQHEIPVERLDDRRRPTRTWLTHRRTVRALADVATDDLRYDDLRDFLDRLAGTTVRRRGSDQPISITTVNKYRTAILTVLRWAVRPHVGLLPAERLTELTMVEAVQDGRTPARTPEPIESIPEAAVRRLVDHARAQAADITVGTRQGRHRRRSWLQFALAVEIQWETAMRPSELVELRVVDLSVERTPDGEVWWVYEPERHKTRHRGKRRRVWLNAQAQLLLGEAIELQRTDEGQHLLGFARPDEDERIFPWYTPRQPGQGYYQKFRRACCETGLPAYTPNQIRHAGATRLARHNVEGARSQLGHQDLRTT